MRARLCPLRPGKGRDPQSIPQTRFPDGALPALPEGPGDHPADFMELAPMNAPFTVIRSPLALEDHPAIATQIAKVMDLIAAGLKGRDGKTAIVKPRGCSIRRERANEKKSAIRAIYQADPNATLEAIVARVGCSRATVRKIRNELGLPVQGAKALGSRFEIAYEELIAERGQISNIEAARIIGCSRSGVTKVRQRIAKRAWEAE